MKIVAKYIDKDNLPQYKYFNNFVSRHDELMDVTTDLLTWQTMMERKGDRRSMIDAQKMYERARKKLPEFVYKYEEDQKKCANDLKARKNVNNYISVLLILSFIQGKVTEDRIYVQDEIAKRTRYKYQYDKKNGKYYYEVTQIPKLLLINSDLYNCYKDFKDLDTEALQKIIDKMDKTINYIINVQADEVSEYCYFVSLKSEKGLEVRRIDRFTHMDFYSNSKKKTMSNDIKAVLYCLLDYLLEYEKLQNKKKKYEVKEGGAVIKDNLTSKFISKSSVKVFDLKKDNDKIEAYRYTKRNVSGWLKGYEKSPHTRRGHMRKLKSGKEVFVRAAVIHKEKFDSIESAHRINQ